MARRIGVVSSVVFGLLLGSCAPHTCCPEGPPYAFACSEGFYYYFHGNRLVNRPSPSAMLTQSPWRHLGKVERGSGVATGVLIHPNFVLTAAHAVTDGNRLNVEPWTSFTLARPCQSCMPYGTRVVERVWVPREWLDNVGGSYDSEETRAYDWALLELRFDANTFADGVPDLLPMPVSNQVYDGFADLTPRAAGYACGEQLDGTVRRDSTPYATDGSGAFLGEEQFPSSGGAGGGALYRTSLEGVAGMSGGPVWVEQGGEPILVGILIGSPQEACNQGENWVVGLSITTRQRIIQVLSTGTAANMAAVSPQGGGGGGDFCPGLFSITQPPCAGSIAGSGGGNCGNVEEVD